MTWLQALGLFCLASGVATIIVIRLVSMIPTSEEDE